MFLVKELPGHPETRFYTSFSEIVDFGLASQQKPDDKQQVECLFIKYTDQLGIENKPVLGEFVGAISQDVNSQIYALVGQSRADK